MKWIKPNGVEIESNDRPGSIEMAKKAGWKPVKSNQPKQGNIEGAGSGAITQENIKE